MKRKRDKQVDKFQNGQQEPQKLLSFLRQSTETYVYRMNVHLMRVGLAWYNYFSLNWENI